MIVKTITGGPFAENCYIVASEQTKTGVVIDPGSEIDTIIYIIESMSIRIKSILCTHGHIDHTAGVKELQNHLQVPFFMHKEDMSFLKEIPERAGMFGLKTEGIPTVDGLLNDGDAIECGNSSLKVIHTPGHTPGGVCLLSERELFSGDSLFAGSIGRTDLPGGNYSQLIYSIKTKLLVLDENLIVYCGHGGTTTIGNEKLNNPFLQESDI